MGVLFKNKIDDSPYKYSGQEIFATNPSLQKGTKVLTDGGIFPIEELEGKTFKVVNLNGEWSDASCWLSGKNKNLWKITFNGGVEIFCTEEHKWAILDNRGNYFKSLTADLSEGDKIPVNLTEKKYGDLGTYSDGFLTGWIYGDGWITKRKDNEKQQVGIIISKKDFDNGIKDIIQKKLSEIGVETVFPERKNRQSIWYEFNTVNEKLNNFLESFGAKGKEFGLPSKIWNECSKEFVYGFLDGLISSDGYISKYRVVITSSHEKLAKDLLEFLGFMGICVTNIEQYASTNFTGGKKLPRYDLYFSTRFIENWNITNKYKQNSLEIRNKKRDYYFRTIESIEKTDLFEDVWDIRVHDDTHCFSLANVITGNCSEQPLPPNGVCNLGSIDLSKFYDKDKDKCIDWFKLGYAVRWGVRFLDAVVDKNTYPTEEIRQWAIDNRSIGIGVMGYADLCLMMEIPYGSPEALSLLNEILRFVSLFAENESIKMGREYGVPKACENLPLPRRNITLTTIAPTGTISLLAGCSSGIEPIFSEITIRNDKTGTYTFENDLADKDYFRCAVSMNGAKEVTWEEHIMTLATAQKHIDSGVSKTINFPTHTHKETIGKAVLMAWKEGCKGLAVYRNNSRKKEVLTPKLIKKDKCPICGEDLTINESGKLRCLNHTKDEIIEKITNYYD